MHIMITIGTNIIIIIIIETHVERVVCTLWGLLGLGTYITQDFSLDSRKPETTSFLNIYYHYVISLMPSTSFSSQCVCEHVLVYSLY